MQENLLEKFKNSDNRFYRTNFFNTLSGLRSPFLVGTKNAQGIANLALFNSVVHIGANPPLLGMIFRPEVDDVRRHTLENIKETGFYTLNLVNKDLIDKAHQCSAKYAAEDNEFEKVALTEAYQDEFFAPFVGESFLKMGLKMRELIEIQSNKTLMCIGEIESIYMPESIVASSGSILHEALNTCVVSGLEDYYTLDFYKRMAFARP